MSVKIVEFYFLLILFISQREFVRADPNEKYSNLNYDADFFKYSTGHFEKDTREFLFTGRFISEGTFQVHIEPETSECKNKKGFAEKGKAFKIEVVNEEEAHYRFGPFNAEESMALRAGLIFCVNGQYKKDNWQMPLLHAKRTYDLDLTGAKSKDVTKFDLARSFALSIRNFKGSDKAIGSAGVLKKYLPAQNLLLTKPDYPILELNGITVNAETKQISVDISFTRPGHFEFFVKRRGYSCNSHGPNEEKRKLDHQNQIGEHLIIGDLYTDPGQTFERYRNGLVVCAKEHKTAGPFEEQIVVQPLLDEM